MSSGSNGIKSPAFLRLTSKVSSYRPEIDGIRAFAVLSVIINHFNKEALPGGYLGVDIFFVISGFVITSSFYERPTKNFKDFISGFYERRVKRLIPALSVFVLITSIIICVFNPSPLLNLRTGQTSLIGLSNLYLLKHSTDYFAQSTELNPFTHTWSLSVEEQFYIIFPFLIWFSGFGRQTRNGARNLFMIVGALAIASLIAFIYLYKINQPAAYFLMPTRFWEIATGCLVFIGFKKRASIEQFIGKVPPFISLALILLVMYLPISFAVLSTVSIVILTTSLIASLKKQTVAFRILSNHKITYIGLISYSLYLWHWGVLSISRWTIGIYWWTVPFQIVLIFSLATLSHRWVETPMRNINFFKYRRQTFFSSGGVMIFVATVLTSLSQISIIRNNIYFYANAKSKFPHLASTWWKDEYSNYIDQCHIEKNFNTEYLQKCLKINRQENKNINFVLGDSHARNYMPAIRKAFIEKRDTLYMTNGQSCLFSLSDYSFSLSDDPIECKKQILSSIKYLKKFAKAGDFVFIGQSLYSSNLKNRVKTKYFDGIARITNLLKDNGIKVFLMDGTYPPPIAPEGCVFFPNKSGCSIDKDEVIEAYSDFDNLAFKFSKKYNFKYIRLRDGLCSGEICSQRTKSGEYIWHDHTGHITEKSAEELSPFVINRTANIEYKK